jgi:ABC-type dipeptide/oligopeptide/nickel transport system ATPase component
MVSHDLAVISHLCERIGVMTHGTLIEITTADALASGNVRHPYTQQLLRSNRGFDRSGAEIADNCAKGTGLRGEDRAPNNDGSTGASDRAG